MILRGAELLLGIFTCTKNFCSKLEAAPHCKKKSVGLFLLAPALFHWIPSLFGIFTADISAYYAFMAFTVISILHRHIFFLLSSEIFPRDSTLKDKFIKHFTGPVTFSSECSKHFHRLYHNTRDCSTPAYYKRCARLLTRLAMSPLCTQS
uniref:ALK and LTK ligand 1 n=3 Tax=Psittaciformes TaxID=9223 RepID=A0A8B9F565_9PSIT